MHMICIVLIKDLMLKEYLMLKVFMLQSLMLKGLMLKGLQLRCLHAGKLGAEKLGAEKQRRCTSMSLIEMALRGRLRSKKILCAIFALVFMALISWNRRDRGAATGRAWRDSRWRRQGECVLQERAPEVGHMRSERQPNSPLAQRTSYMSNHQKCQWSKIYSLLQNGIVKNISNHPLVPLIIALNM